MRRRRVLSPPYGRKGSKYRQGPWIVSELDRIPSLVRDLFLTEDGWQIKKREVTRALANNAKRATELLLIRLSDWAQAEKAQRPKRKVMRPIFDEDGNSLM